MDTERTYVTERQFYFLSKRLVVVFLLIIILIATGMRIYGLNRQSLWYDEVSEETAFQRHFLIKDQMVPYSPPLHSFFIYPITLIFPGNDFALRMVPVTFGLITIPLFFIFSRRIFNEKVGLIATFLLAISQFHIWYSQDARMYTLQWMLNLVSIIYFIRTLEQPRLHNFTGYLISTVGSLYTLQLSIFVIAFQFIYVLIFLNKYRKQLLKWIITFSASIVLYIPWLIFSLSSLKGATPGYPKPLDFKAILYTIYVYCIGFSIGPSLQELHLDHFPAVIKPYLSIMITIGITYGTLFMLGVWSLRKERSKLVFSFLFLVIPVIGVVVLSKVMPSITYNVRYTGVALFGFLLFIAKGIDWMTSLKNKVLGSLLASLLLIAVTGFSAYSYWNYQFDKRYHKEDIRGAVAYIKEVGVEDDIILCLMNAEVFNRYADEEFQCNRFPVSAKDDREVLNTKMNNLINGRNRLWLVLSREWYAGTLSSSIKEWLDIHYKEIKHLHKDVTEIANVRIYYYDLTKKQSGQ